MPADAIEHALASGDHERVVRLLETHGRPTVLQGYVQTVEDWLRRLPQEWRDAGPRANSAFAWSLLMRGQLGEVECCVRKAEVAANLGQAAPNAEAKAALAEIQTIRAALISLQGDTERGCELAQRALAETPQEDLHLQGLAHFSLGTALSYAGRVVEAIEAYEQALPLCQASGNTVISMMIVANLALLHTVRGQLRAAADLCRRVIEATEGPSRPLPPAVATVYGNYDSVLYEWDRLDAAYGETQKWLELSKRGGHVAAVTYGHVLLSRILQARGDIATAEHALKEAIPLLGRGMPAWVAASVVSQQVSLALAQREPATAWQALSRTGVSIDDESNHQREVIQLPTCACSTIWVARSHRARIWTGRSISRASC